MKTFAFLPGKVDNFASYLNYLFLRFPGQLGPDVKVELDYLDTYDHHWVHQGQVWIRSSDELVKVSPPSVFPLDSDVKEFGLQAPVVIGHAVLNLRSVTWVTPDDTVLEGQIVKCRRESWLIVRGQEGRVLDTLIDTLNAEGMEPWTRSQPTWVSPKGPLFLPPRDWPEVEAGQEATPALLERIRDSWRVARQYERGILLAVDSECLHQFRVHLRRARSWASAGAQWQVIPEWQRLKDVLRLIQQETNALRDLDVLILDLPHLRAKLPKEQRDELQGWQDQVKAAQRTELRRVQKWLTSDEYQRYCTEVDRLCTDLQPLGEPWSWGQVARYSLAKVSSKLKTNLKALGTDPQDAQLHELRILSKRLRYTLDGLGTVIPGAKDLLASLKATQVALGDFQDRSVQWERFQAQLGVIRTSESGVDALAFGMLVGILYSEQEPLRQKAIKASRVLGSKKFLQTLEAHREA
jgi:CHAD domain-containing protein